MAYYHSKYGGRRKKSKAHRFLLYLIALVFVAILVVGYIIYTVIYSSNVWTDGKETSLYIATGSTFDDVKANLYKKGMIIHRNNFEWLAKKKNYPNNIKPGRYILKEGMNNNELLNLLRSGNQTPMKLIFNNVRKINDLARKVALQIEADSASIVNLLNDTSYQKELGFNQYTIKCIFIPNTYNVFWDITAKDFIKRMHWEFKNFWNDDRKAKAEKLKFSIPEIITLASIVEKETQKNTEKKRIAGVYINRLSRGWRLQADPTLVYALGDFSVKRVLNEHKEIDSPFNTYKYGGIPPGPICIPSIASIDAVLNYEKHKYLYFCAKDDLSGYHNFAKNYQQHEENARKYRRALNKRKIWK